jgi:hypothetical protein
MDIWSLLKNSETVEVSSNEWAWERKDNH